MGDTVNVASRLEGMNKNYGTMIMASGAVVAHTGGTIHFRPLGTAQAKGRASALEIYEVLGAEPKEPEALDDGPKTHDNLSAGSESRE